MKSRFKTLILSRLCSWLILVATDTLDTLSHIALRASIVNFLLILIIEYVIKIAGWLDERKFDK